MPPGSKLLLAAEVEEEELIDCKRRAGLKNHQLEFIKGDTGDRRFLETLPFAEFDNILILPHNPKESEDYEAVDATTIKTLVYVRDIAKKKGFELSLTTEMLLEESRSVADVGELGDFVVGDEIIGRIIAQLAEEHRLRAVFRVLLTVEGSEIYLRPAKDYVLLNKAVNGYTILEGARRRGEIFIGYIRKKDIRVNPRKSHTVSLGGDDKVIVIAEH